MEFSDLKNDYRIDISTDKFRRFELDLLGVSETHIPRGGTSYPWVVVGSMKLGGIEFVYD